MPRSKKRARTGKTPDAQPIQTGWYTIRKILDERRIANRVQYLVDWDDDPVTGRPYDPEWAASADVTLLAKQEWWARKRAESVLEEPPSQPEPEPAAKSKTPASQASQGDQSPRPANSRRLQKTNPARRSRSSSASSSGAGPPKKRLRLRLSCSPSEEPVPSFTSTASPTPCDLPEEGVPTAPFNFVVGIRKDPGFDTTAYLSVAGSQSTSYQSQSYQSQSLSELEEQDRRVTLSSQITRETVPDSQDYSGQSFSTNSFPRAADGLVQSQGESLCAVIPDSLDRERTVEVDLGDTNDSLEHIPQSSVPGDPCANSGIPSRQQESKQPDELNISGFYNGKGSCNTDSASQQATSSDQIPESQIEAPTFLTQIEAAPSFPISSSPNSAVSSRASSPAEATSSPSANFRVSQDAQVASRRTSNFFDVVLATDSNKTGTTSNQQPSNDLDTSASHNSVRRADHIFNQLVDHLDNIVDSQQAQPEIMSDDADNNTGTQRSAVEELSEMFTLNPTVASEEPPFIVPDGDSAPIGSVAEGAMNPPSASETLPSQWQPATQPASIAIPYPSDPSTVASVVAINTAPDVGAQILMPMHLHEEQPGTISPADILESAGEVVPGRSAALLDPISVIPAAVFGSSADPITLGQEPVDSPASSTTTDDPVVMQHVITLPFQASLRPQYDDTLLSYRKQVKDFSEVFSNEEYVEPEPALVAKIDGLFIALRNLCDYPQDLVGTTLEQLSAREQIKYACDANPKFCFVFELLQGIETNIRVLIIAQSVDLLRLLSRVAEALDIDCTAKALGLNSDAEGSACNVILALPDEKFGIDDFDVVIGFDHSFGSSPVAQALSSQEQAVRPPMVLTLVTTHSIEHIDQQLPEDLGPLERRNALLAGIVNARKLTSDPDRGYPEPHEIASMFCDFLNGAVEGVLWEPVPLPEDVLDIYMSSQPPVTAEESATAEAEGGRKRKLDHDDEEDAKRMRTIPKESTVSREEVPLPDDVRWLLDSATAASQNLPGGGVSISVPLAVLQALAEKNSELERRVVANDMEAEYKCVIDSLEARVKEYERTSDKTYQAYRAAVEERTRFEREKKKTDSALQVAQESAQKDSAKLQAKIGELDATIARLTSSGEGEESPLNTSERLLKEAQESIKKLERRLENATQDGEYAKNAYQDASNAASVAQNENKELKEQNAKLLQRASDNVTRIHEIQNESTARSYGKQIETLQTLLREREAELDRAREEVRQSRTRRETRQASVPRSPRMGLMSPRTGRPYGAPASRGTSPTGDGPAMIGALPGNGNGRWNHLRE